MGTKALFTGRTSYYAAHNNAPGKTADHVATLEDSTLKAWAAQMEGQERAEEKRLRKPQKKQYHAENAASYAKLAADGLSSPTWRAGGGW